MFNYPHVIAVQQLPFPSLVFPAGQVQTTLPSSCGVHTDPPLHEFALHGFGRTIE